ncbi:hypothetical protein tinsulaeT_02870 [Thalassotalea insulae]|uniref:glutathione transferase n=2 Tax=Thalassotalea insulae TaxID=2056778 RepID=A0ABQ6GLY3_9GAMM|nr:hypothetical protein tinsulaeT_02870 [Thalassotalea insulae]
MNTIGVNQAKVQIYGPGFSSFVRTLLLLCEEHQIDYSLGFELDDQAIEFKSEQYLALHPYGKLPILKHNELVLAETASIGRYLLSTFVPDYPQRYSIVQQAKIDSFCAIASIYLDKAIIRDYVLEFAFPKGESGEVRLDVVKAAQPQVLYALKVIENELINGECLNSDFFGLADALLAPMLHYLSGLPEGFSLLDKVPEVEKYFQQLMIRASCQKVLTIKS